MKIAIVIPVMAPEVAKDWEYVVYCLNRTLRAILNNNAVDQRIYVACQSRPTAMLSDDRIVFVKSEHPIPDSNDGAVKRQDKGAKTQLAFQRAAEFKPDYIMQVDADDMVSRHLFDYLVSSPGYDAYCVNCGYEWWEGRRSMTIRHHFHKCCGSTFIAKYNADLFPFWVGNQPPPVPPRVCDNPHTHIEDALLAGGFKVHYLNKPMVVYLSGGSDHLREKGNKVLLKRRVKDWALAFWRNRKLNKSLRDEFAIQE